MDNSLFFKYQKKIHERDIHKEVVLEKIKEITGVSLSLADIELQKKKILLHISSVHKARFHTTKLQEKLKEEGYTLSY